MLEPGDYAARAPYWDVAQVPEGAGVSASSPCANANANAGEVRWQLLADCSDAAGTVLARETAWESSVKAALRRRRDVTREVVRCEVEFAWL